MQNTEKSSLFCIGKKALAIALCLVMALSLLPATALAAEEVASKTNITQDAASDGVFDTGIQTAATSSVTYATYSGVDYENVGLSADRIAALKKAQQMVTIKWTAIESFPAWRSSGGSLNTVVATDGTSSTSFTKGKTYTGIPYSMADHSFDNTKWKSYVDAGSHTNSNMTGSYYGNGTTTAHGIDCSYFVYVAIKAAVGSSKITYQTTATMLNSSYYTKLSGVSEMLPGDLFLKNGHVMMYVGKSGSKYAVFEADASDSKCSYNLYSSSYISSYYCYRFNGFDDAPATYTIKFNANGGSGTMSNLTCTYGVKTNLPTNEFTRTGYTFSGWYAYRSSDGTYKYQSSDGSQDGWYKSGSQPSGWTYKIYKDWVQAVTPVNKDTVTMYALWTPNTYTMKFNANGGSGTMSNLVCTYGVKTDLPSNKFTRTGYTFSGWYAYRSSDGTYKYQSSDGSQDGWYKSGSEPSGWTYKIYKDWVQAVTPVNKDTVTMYALWTPNTYTIKFNANGGSGTMSDLVCTYGVKTSLPTNKFTRTGYTWSGWYAYRAVDGKTRYQSPDKSEAAWYKPGTEPDGWTYFIYKTSVEGVSAVNKDTVTMYSIWEPNTYTITFDANGGSAAPEKQIKTYNETLILSGVTPVRAGYTFLGWSSSSTATTATYQAGGKYTGNSNVTLYAVWKLNEIEVTTAPQIVVSDAVSCSGQDVEVTVSLKNNPGISSFTLNVDYDETKLILNGIDTSKEIGGTFTYAESTHTVVWLSEHDSAYEGTVFTLKFTVKDNVDNGETSVTVTYKQGDICNYDEEDVNFKITAGSVSISSYLPGDINGDGYVNNKDLIRLMKYLADDSTTVVKAALDVNNDQFVNNKDLIRLMKHLADDTIEIY